MFWKNTDGLKNIILELIFQILTKYLVVGLLSFQVMLSEKAQENLNDIGKNPDIKLICCRWKQIR